MVKRCCSSESSTVSCMVLTLSSGTSGSTSCTTLPIAETTLAGCRLGSGSQSHAKGMPYVAARVGQLRQRHVEHGRGAGLIQSVVLHIAYHADHRAHAVGEEVQRQLLADGIVMGPELFGHRLADEHRCRATGGIGVVEVAPAHQRNMHRVQIAGADEPHVDFRLVGHRHHRLAFDLHRLMRAAAGQRQSVDHPGGLDAGQRPNALEHALEEAGHLLRRAELLRRDRQVHGDHVIRVEARIDGTQHPETANEQACADQQHQ